MYNIHDVIIDKENEQLESAIGKVCYAGTSPYECLFYAIHDMNRHIFKNIVLGSFLPFEIETDHDRSHVSKYPCIIIKKD